MKRTVFLGSIAVLALLVFVLIQGCGRASYSRSAPPGSARTAGTAPLTLPSHAPIGIARDARRSASGLATAAAPNEELWVIARVSADAPAAPADDAPGCGAMMCVRPGETLNVPMPLKHTNVDAHVSGYIASVTVRQEFHNPFDEKIEAVYVFPLPQDAAVSEFVMTVGDRRIRGIVREREEAERIYSEARSQGYVASLLTQERPNVFTQKVANIESGRSIDVDITYFNTLTYSDGWYEFVFPMVVGPRFNPPHTTDGIGAARRGSSAYGYGTGQETNVEYLHPRERSGHDIALELTIDAGVAIEEIDSPTHVIDRRDFSSSQASLALSPRDSIPNKDFVLRYRVAGDAPKADVITHVGERGGYFTLMLYPPRFIETARRAPVEMVFVFDCSGSMSGEPLAQAKRAVKRALRQLAPEDTFQVICFSNDASKLGDRPITATNENLKRGVKYVDRLKADGGTMMIRGIEAALRYPNDPERTRHVVFLTDGFIGNEREILGAVHENLGSARIFSFGLGSSPNRYLMHRMAKLGRGTVTFVGLDESAADVMDLFVERVSHPVLTDLRIDWQGARVEDVTPGHLPDLFAGRPVVLTGRIEGSGTATARIRGRIGAETVEIPVAVELDGATSSNDALASVWARQRIADMSDRLAYDDDPHLHDRIRDLALEYGIMSAYTAFIAVDSSRRTEGDGGTTVPVAVPVPDGVRYDTTVADS